ncbi:MAG: hypothetical protein HOP02_10975 [Methylococcaceae bacterium]|nr:hypothetical protein [Methylococcaceae bacterium]
MVIYIVYESCWQNSFLDGSDEQPINKNNPRKFKATSKSNITDIREISLTTVLGVLCRLIGDQRKLYQARQSNDFYFKDIEQFIRFSRREKLSYSETAFIVNKSEDRPPQSSFMGVLSDETPLFFSEYAKNLWSIFDFNINELFDFILKPRVNINPLGQISPNRYLRSRIEEIISQDPIMLLDSKLLRLNISFEKESNKNSEKIKSGKKVTEKDELRLKQLEQAYSDLKSSEEAKEFNDKLLDVLHTLKNHFPGNESGKEHLIKDQVYPMGLYSAALYIMLEGLKKSGIDTSRFINKNGNIQGFNPYGFNGIRDFINPIAGGKKRCGGTPTLLSKASGVLTIDLDIAQERANELEEMIEAAGVSSFYLGKKGLAYACINKLLI